MTTTATVATWVVCGLLLSWVFPFMVLLLGLGIVPLAIKADAAGKVKHGD